MTKSSEINFALNTLCNISADPACKVHTSRVFVLSEAISLSVLTFPIVTFPSTMWFPGLNVTLQVLLKTVKIVFSVSSPVQSTSPVHYSSPVIVDGLLRAYLWICRGSRELQWGPKWSDEKKRLPTSKPITSSNLGFLSIVLPFSSSK